jgi:predicted RNase H-like HicB family nuclease
MRTAHVIYHQEEDGWWAEAPNDFPSFFAAGDTFEEAKARVWEGLKAMGVAENLGVLHVTHQPDPLPTPPVSPLARSSTGLAASPRGLVGG